MKGKEESKQKVWRIIHGQGNTLFPGKRAPVQHKIVFKRNMQFSQQDNPVNKCN